MTLPAIPIHMIPLARIGVPKQRIRKVRQDKVRDLLANIEKLGLLQPIVVCPLPITFENEVALPQTWQLTAGEHRLQAFAQYYAQAKGLPISFADAPVPRGCIPAISVDEVPEILFEIELAENLYRVELEWHEKVAALARLHQSAIDLDPDTEVMATARKLASVSGQSVETVRRNVAQAQIINDHLADPDVSAAKSQREAWNVIKKQTERHIRELAPRVITTSHTILPGDCRDILPTLPDATFALILTDPPYGIEANAWDQGGIEQHEYDDSELNAFDIAKVIAEEGFRVALPEANLFMFHNVTNFPELRCICEEAGWNVWPRPLIWAKGNEGMRPWGQMGFAFTYEAILFATKGGKGLVSTHIDVFYHNKPRGDRVHAAQKPVPLLVELINLAALPGDHILDPCAGSGTIFQAGNLTKTHVTGIELSMRNIDLCNEALKMVDESRPSVTESKSTPTSVAPSLESLL